MQETDKHSLFLFKIHKLHVLLNSLLNFRLNDKKGSIIVHLKIDFISFGKLKVNKHISEILYFLQYFYSVMNYLQTESLIVPIFVQIKMSTAMEAFSLSLLLK